MSKERRLDISIILIVALGTFYGAGSYFAWMYRLLDYIQPNVVDMFMEVYSYIAQALGIAMAMIIIRYKYDEAVNKYMFIAPHIIVGVLLLFIYVTDSAWTVIFAGLIINLFIGIQTGLYCLLMAQFTSKGIGCIVMAIAYAMSSILNAIVGLADGGEFIQKMVASWIYIAAGVLVIIVFLASSSTLQAVKREKSDDTASITIKRSIIITTGLVILGMWCISSMGFYFPIPGMEGGYYVAVRGIYAVGLLAAGFINVRDKKYGAVAGLVTLIYPFLCVFMSATSGAMMVLFAVAYFFTGFLAVYRFGIFADLSHGQDTKGNSTAYLCGVGLIFGRIGESIGAAVGIGLKDNPLLLITIIAVTLVITTVLFVIHYVNLFTPIRQEVRSFEDRFNEFRSSYGLTIRESDVLKLLCDGKTNSQIAEQLFVSENTVRFHVSNILKKTSCGSRADVVNLFNK